MRIKPSRSHILPSFVKVAAIHRSCHACLSCDDDVDFFDKETKEYFCLACANEAWFDHFIIDGLNELSGTLEYWKKWLFTEDEIATLNRRSEP